MLCLTDPAEAYRRIELDAHVAGKRGGELALLCLEEAGATLGRALWAAERGENALLNRSLHRAENCLSALRCGVDPARPLAASLLDLYGAASRAIVASQSRFDGAVIERVRADLAEIRAAFSASSIP